VFVKANGIATKKIFLIWLPDQQWEWKGTIHNYLVNKNINHQKLFIKELSIKYNQSEGSKSHRFKDSLDKGQYDIEQLLEELASEELNINNVHRYFQLAYGYRQIKDYNEAIKYFKRISKFEQASIDFRYTSSVLVAKYLLLLKSHDDEIEFFLNEAIRLDKERKEAYYYLALYRRKQDNLIMALATLEKANLISFSGKEFIYMEEDIYLWRIKYELAFVYFLLHKYAESSAMIRELKTEGYLPLIEMGFLDSLLHKMNL
jgi:tetratricopeptide (TPR) repeat protein